MIDLAQLRDDAYHIKAQNKNAYIRSYLLKISQDLTGIGMPEESNVVQEVANNLVPLDNMTDNLEAPEKGMMTGGLFESTEKEPPLNPAWDVVSKILPQLYLGSTMNTEDEIEHAKKLGINVSLDLTENPQPDSKIFELTLKVPIAEGEEPTLEQIKIGTDFIRKCIKEGKKVFVHCRTGRHRAPSFVACYLVQYEGYSTEGAFKYIRARRPVTQPSEKQIAKVMLYEDVIRGKKFRN